MAVAMILIALVCAYLLYITGAFIARQITINDNMVKCLNELAEWHEAEDKEIALVKKHLERVETVAGNAQNKATENAKKIERSILYDSEH